MDESLNNNKALVSRIELLERERDELRKDIEQLCMQQAGPGYLAVATRMHFQRTAGLEQEIDELKKKLAACITENVNLQEELSEAYRIKSQLADLHSAEVAKSMEAEKQAKFFQGCVAAAFAERDHSVMEAEKSKEKEELASQKLDVLQQRMEELSSACLEEKKLSTTLRTDLEKREKENALLRKVIDKFYDIRWHSGNGSDDISFEDKCECLLNDSADMWIFSDQGETSTSIYISSLEVEVETLGKSILNLQNKLKMGLDIEKHLKKKVLDLKRERIIMQENMKRRISELHHNHSQHRVHIMNELDEGFSHLKSIVGIVEEKMRQFHTTGDLDHISSQTDMKLPESDRRDVHINTDLITKVNISGLPNTVAVENEDASEALAQALQEKVAALLLLSQQEERYLLESNVNAALQKKLEELQRNLLQVTNEKVKALMDLAQVKQEHHLLQEKVDQYVKHGKLLADTGPKSIRQETDGRLKNILKKTYLKQWINPLDSSTNEAASQPEYNRDSISHKKSSHNIDFARMKIENAALLESLESMAHLTSSVHRLRLTLAKVKESATSEGTVISKSVALDNAVTEAKLLKTALGSILPVSWSAEADISSSQHLAKQKVFCGDLSSEKVDFVSSAGLEMVELLMFAAQLLKDFMS